MTKDELKRGDYVRKKGDKGQWHGKVCGFYFTDRTPDGVAVESVFEANSVQIYPASALERWDGPTAPNELAELRGKIEALKETAHTDAGTRNTHNAAIDLALAEIDKMRGR